MADDISWLDGEEHDEEPESVADEAELVNAVDQLNEAAVDRVEANASGSDDSNDGIKVIIDQDKIDAEMPSYQDLYKRQNTSGVARQCPQYQPHSSLSSIACVARRTPHHPPPPHSSLLIIGGKSLAESEYYRAFGRFGRVENVEVKEEGITYVRFSRTSKAADALEELNGKCIGDDPQPLTIGIKTKKHRRYREKEIQMKSKENFLILVTRHLNYDVEALRNKFIKYGEIDSIIRDKAFAFIKYFRFSHAARAFEGEEELKVWFDEPQPAGNLHLELDRADQGLKRGRRRGTVGGHYGYGGHRGDQHRYENNSGGRSKDSWRAEFYLQNIHPRFGSTIHCKSSGIPAPRNVPGNGLPIPSIASNFTLFKDKGKKNMSKEARNVNADNLINLS